MRPFTKLKRDDRGATTVEYALILALIVLAILGALRGFANKSIEMWGNVAVTVLST